MKKYLRIISVILAVVLFSQTPLAQYVPRNTATVLAEELKYVSDIKVYKCSSSKMSATIEQAKKDGYEIAMDVNLPIDLNQGAGGDFVLLGYKKTDSADKAVRSVKMLEMKHGYEWLDYQSVAEQHMEKLEPVAADLLLAAKEAQSNLEKGNKSAKEAKDFLNYLYFDENGKEYPMGDYMFGGRADINHLKKFVIQMNTASLTALYSHLALGVSDTGEKWVERISKADCYKVPTTNSIYSYWDRMYYNYSVDLLEKIKEFAKNYRAMEARKAANNGDVKESNYESKADNPNSDNASEIIDASANKSSGDVLVEVAYNLLNQYTVGNEKAGDYILRLAEQEYASKLDMRSLYPLVDCFTNGQFAMMKIVGFEQMAVYLNQSDEFFAEIAKRKVDTENAIKKATKGKKDKISIYEGVNREFYEREVALTSEATRQNTANTIYTDLTREGSFYDDMNLAMIYIGLAASVAGLVTGCITLGLLIAGSQLTVWGACASIIGTGVLASIGGVLGCAMVVLGWLALAAMLVCLIVYMFKWFFDEMDDPDEEDYSTMPQEIYDIAPVVKNKKKYNEIVKYVAVKNNSGKPQDINADNGKRWNVLYYSTNSDLGSPLCVDSNGKIFYKTVGNPNRPTNCESVGLFGANSAANLNAYVKKDSASPIYLHYVTEGQLNGSDYEIDDTVEDFDNKDEDGLNKGKKVAMKKSDKYVHGLIVKSEDSESAAKAGIQKEVGYQVYDKNLTPGTGKYTYLGYKSTNIKSEAVTDIRIVPNYGGGDISRGGASYAVAGQLPDGSALVFTSYTCAGTPIINDFKTTSSYLPMEDEYEPVNMLCGGEAYSISGDFKNNRVFLYFKPSVAYTSGDKYLSGFQFMSSMKTSKTRDYSDLIKERGLKEYSPNFTAGSPLPTGNVKYYYGFYASMGGGGYGYYERDISVKYSSHITKLCYAETYNPYRAIYDVKVYSATPRASSLSVSINTTKGNYAVTETTMVSDVALTEGHGIKDSTKNWPEDKVSDSENIRVTKSRGYVDPTNGTDNPVNKNRYKTVYSASKNIRYDDGDSALTKGDVYNYYAQSLYVLGRTDGMTEKPLQNSDLDVTEKYTAEKKGWHSIERLDGVYEKYAFDLSLNEHKAFIFIKGEKTQPGKYISEIDTSVYKRPKNTEKHTYTDDELKEYDKSSDDMARLGVRGKVSDEILEYNFAIPDISSWYCNPKAINTAAAYVGVSRTDDENRAITGILFYKSKKLPPIKIMVDGLEYRRTSDPLGDYYLYYTKALGGSPGRPIEQLDIDHELYDPSHPTALVVESDDKGGVKYSSTQGCLNYYIHMIPEEYESSIHTTNEILTRISVVSGKTLDDAVISAYKKGLAQVSNTSLNFGAGNNHLYIACNTRLQRYDELDEEEIEEIHENSADVPDDADGEDLDWSDFDIDFDEITGEDDSDDFDWSDFDFDFDFDEDVVENADIYDLLIKQGEPEDHIIHNGVTYVLASKTSLNEGTKGTPLYLYYTTEKTIYIDGRKVELSPIMSMRFCTGDVAPFVTSDTEDNEDNHIDETPEETTAESKSSSSSGSSSSGGFLPHYEPFISIPTNLEIDDDGNIFFSDDDSKKYVPKTFKLDCEWEKVMDENDRKANLNAGIFNKDKNTHKIISSGLYMYVQRTNFKARPKAGINYASGLTEVQMNDIKLSSN